MNCPHAVHVGVFLLGARDTELDGFKRHLENCGLCQAEVAELASLPALLAAVRSADHEPLDRSEPPPDDLLDRLLTEVVAERRSRRRRGVLLLAAAVLIVAVAIGGLMFGLLGRPAKPAQPAQQALPAVPVSPAVLTGASSPFGVSATASVLAQPWGTRIDLTLMGLAPDTSCQLVARARDGRTETTASWRVTYQGAVQVSGMTSIATADLTELAVVDQGGRQLITIAVTPPEGTTR